MMGFRPVQGNSMSPLASGVIGVSEEDLRKFFSGQQIEVAVVGDGTAGGLLLRLLAALARLLAALALGVAIDGREADRRQRIDFAPQPGVDGTQGFHQFAIVAAQDASASASAACCALSAAAARSAASRWAL